jgi:basic membrane protein A
MTYKTPLALLLVFFSLTYAHMITAQDQTVSRICMVLNLGNVNDGTFNEVAYVGLADIQHDYDLADEDAFYLESNGEEDWVTNVAECLARESDVVITVGFLLGDITQQAALENPDVYFIGLDQFVDGIPNYAGVQFRDDEASFMMGYMAGLVTETGVVAGIYGPRIPVILRFRNGFENGVRLASEHTEREITVLGRFHDGFDLTEDGEATATEFVERGADVVFNAAGLTGSAGIIRAAQLGAYVIGVDMDEYYTSFGGGTVEGADRIISSALKRVNVGVYDLVSMLLEGDFESFPGGTNYILSIENGGLAFTQTDRANIDPTVYDEVVEIGGAIAYQEIETGVDPVTGELYAFSDPSAVVETWIQAALVNLDSQTISALSCSALNEEVNFNIEEALLLAEQNPQLKDFSCTWDGSNSVSCEGTLEFLNAPEIPSEELGEFTVQQRDDIWEVCGF